MTRKRSDYNGMAEVMTIQPNSKYAAHFKELEEQARKNKIGFWANPENIT